MGVYGGSRVASGCENDDEYIKELIGKEASFVSRCCVSFADCSTDCWLKFARLDAIEWVFNVCVCFSA
uniref:Uncharacterized protein n=1 Tax=Rhizophora mucronata TaxID=61149 RepID=A0A2P2P380_RHIMU